MNVNFKRIITFLLFFLSVLVLNLLILGGLDYSFIWRFVLSSIFGGIIGVLCFLLWKSICLNSALFKIEIVLTIFSIFISILLAVLPIGDENLIYNLKNRYRSEKNQINIEQYFEDTNANKHCTLFLLDKTINSKYDLEFPSKLKSIYKLYVEKIIKDGYSKYPEKKNISYLDFTKAKLCVDLLCLNSNDTTGNFNIYTFDGDCDPLYTKDIEFGSKEKITKAIIDLLDDSIIISNETESDFKDLYNKIDNKVQIGFEQFSFNQFTIYVYSDFIHDKKISQNYNKDKFECDTSNISDFQKSLNGKSIVQNYFIIPSKTENIKSNINLYSSILKSIGVPYYENHIKIDDVSNTKNKPLNKIKYLDNDLQLFCQVYTNECYPNLSFPNKNFYIKLLKDLPNNQVLIINNNNALTLKTSEYTQIDSTDIIFYWKGSCPVDNDSIEIEIVDDKGVHAIVGLKFKKAYSEISKYLLPIFCFLSCFFLGIIILVIIHRNTRN